MRKLGLVVVMLAACSGGPRLPRSAQGEPVVEVRGALKSGSYALGRADLEALPRLTIRGVEPGTNKETVWEGPSAAAIVSERVELAKGADTAVVRTAERAAIPIPLTVIRQMKPVLADRADGARLPRRILAWPTLERLGLDTDPRAAGWWAHDVVAFEIVDWQRTFAPALATPDGAADAARRGSAWYGERCISCHRLRGVGGERGPDLTTVAARLRPEPFATLLAHHAGWGESAREAGAEGVTELWTFLTAVAAASPGGRIDAFTAERDALPSNAP